ncbi:proline dehydrogenase [bacterium]|nr:proline dehydrogenase [bacterium]
MSGIPFYAKRWVSGATMPEALERISTLNSKKISVTLDLLGENITNLDQAKACTNEYVLMLEEISKRNLSSHVSVKLTMLGLDVNEDVCFENLKAILSKADELGNRVALDMEGTPYTERTLRIYEAAAGQFKSPEIVLQAYLHRTEKDIERVLKANGRMRLCKGAYKEKPEHALQKMPDILANYKKLMQRLLKEANRICIASHDDSIIDFCKSEIFANKVPNERYEFQMLYGMRAKTWETLASEGHNMTVYLPYGEHWQAYYSRRLAERKENIFFVLRNLFRD